MYSDLQVEKDIVWWELKKKRAAAYANLAQEPEKMVSWFEVHLSN